MIFKIEILNIIAFKLTVQGLNNMRKALQHVPANITRIVDGTSMRHELVLGIFKSISGEPNNAISMDDLMLFANILEKNCPTFMSQKGDFPSNELKKYLSPPVSTCINCDKKLSIVCDSFHFTRSCLLCESVLRMQRLLDQVWSVQVLR